MEIISKEQFYLWKHDPVTKLLMENLENAKQQRQLEMLDPEIIRRDDSRLVQHEFLGGLEVIEQILHINLEDLQTIANEPEEGI